MNKIKTFEEACKKLGVDPASLPDVKDLPQEHQDAIIAHYKLVIITQALNDGWKPNWNDTDEWKYTPWFEIKASKNSPGGSSVVYYSAIVWSSASYVGSRLCFKSRELAEYAGKAFKDLYKQYFLYLE